MKTSYSVMLDVVTKLMNQAIIPPDAVAALLQEHAAIQCTYTGDGVFTFATEADYQRFLEVIQL